MSASSPSGSSTRGSPAGFSPPQNSSANPPSSTPPTSSTPSAQTSPPARSPPPAPPANSSTNLAPPQLSPPTNLSPPPTASSPPQSPPTDSSASSPTPTAVATPPPPSLTPPPPPSLTPPPPLILSPPPEVQLPPSTPTSPSVQPSPPFRNSYPSPPYATRSPNARPAPAGSSHPAPKTATGNVSTRNGTGGGPKFSTTTLVGIAVGGAILVGILAMLILCLVRKRSKKRSQHADYEYSSGPYQIKGEGGRKPRYESPYSSSEVRGKPQPPPPPPLVSNGSRQSSGPAQAHLFTTTYDSGSATEAPSPRKFAPPPPPPGGASSLGNSRVWFTFEQLEEATQGFSRSNLLGQGGFGHVFKGVFPGGLTVAVKRLKVGGKQGEREFQAEVETISRAHHRHLVALVGYCIADTQRLLVYEYVPNGTLESHLHGKGGSVLDWNTRVKIAIGAARGLAYLHEDCQPKIIHRDIKSSNILLDEHFEAKVSDFGLAKYASDTHSHVSTRVMGTFGYMAPEYASTGKLTAKSDVFSFGVVLLELLTGRKPIDSSRPVGNESLVEWARPLLAQALDDGVLVGLVDARLDNDYDLQQLQRMMEITAACVRHSANKRPKMIQVVRALEDDGADLSSGLRPAQSLGSPYESADYENKSDQSEINRLRRMALGTSQDQSAYSGVPSEYGLNLSTSGSEQQSSKEIDSRRHESDEKRWY